MVGDNNIPFVLFITGVSGAGKTTVLKKICSQVPSASTLCLHFDSIGVPPVTEMIEQYGSPSEWQKAMTERWVNTILTEHTNKHLVILEGQVNVQFIKDACAHHKFNNYKAVLIDCDDSVRHERLRMNRNQPELVNADMDNWAQFLRNQALQIQIPILDTSTLTIDEAATQVLKLANL